MSDWIEMEPESCAPMQPESSNALWEFVERERASERERERKREREREKEREASTAGKGRALTEDGCHPPASGLWAQVSSAAPLGGLCHSRETNSHGYTTETGTQRHP